MTASPEDACPYPRPFPAGFHDCPAYRSRPLAVRDSRDRPLPPVRTCAHLDVGKRIAAGHFYARCTLGTAGERESWAAAHPGGRQHGVATTHDSDADVPAGKPSASRR